MKECGKRYSRQYPFTVQDMKTKLLNILPITNKKFKSENNKRTIMAMKRKELCSYFRPQEETEGLLVPKRQLLYVNYRDQFSPHKLNMSDRQNIHKRISSPIIVVNHNNVPLKDMSQKELQKTINDAIEKV